MTTTTFEKILQKIAQYEMDGAADQQLLEDLHMIIVENQLDADENVPNWLMSFFTALQNGQPLAVSQRPDEHSAADIGEFFAALQALAPFDCYDYGEWVRVRLPKHGMLGFLSIEHGYYQVALLADVPDDGLSDISEAKILARPA